MKWRARLLFLPALLLPLPLVGFIVFMVSRQSEHLPLLDVPPAFPMLSREERRLLPTYEHDCKTDADCDSALRCFYNPRKERKHCADSTCQTDDDCDTGMACRGARARNGVDLIRTCSRVGVRREGEQCEPFPFVKEDGCATGLFCTGFCGRPCRLDSPGGCPEGFLCARGDDGPSCRPHCEGQSCPEGQRCVTPLDQDAGSVCMRVYGQDCQSNPCAGEERCEVVSYPHAPGKVYMMCLGSCGQGARCAPGRACTLFQCHEACDPHAAPVCREGFACGQIQRNGPWVCQPGG